MLRPCSLKRVKTRWFAALALYKGAEAVFSLLFPLFVLNGLRLPVGMVGLLTGLISFSAVPGAMLWGALSDRWHRRRPLLVLGCLGSGLCLLGMGLAHTAWQMAFLCLLYGAMAASPAALAAVLITETTPRRHWEATFGAYNALGGWGWVAGLALGAVILPLLERGLSPVAAMRATFGLVAAATLVSAWGVWRTLPEPRRRLSPRHVPASAQRLLALTVVERVLYIPRYVWHWAVCQRQWQVTPPWRTPLGIYSLATVAIFISFTAAFTLLPVFAQQQLHLPTAGIFLLGLLRSLVSAPGYTWAGRWTQRWEARRVQLWALGMRSGVFVGFAALAWLPPTAAAWVGLGVLNVLAGLSWCVIAVAGPVVAGQLGRPGHHGETMGLYNAVQGAARIVGAVLSGYLAQHVGYGSVFVLTALLLLPAMVLLARLPVPAPAADETRPAAKAAGHTA